MEAFHFENQISRPERVDETLYDDLESNFRLSVFKDFFLKNLYLKKVFSL